jgi:glycosyltransferase involved in cell wall biosynthesis
MVTTGKKVGIILYNYPLSVSSTHINSAHLFAQKGYEVYIFIDKYSYNEKLLNFSENNIHIISISQEQMLFNDFLSNFHGLYRNKFLDEQIRKFSTFCFIILNLIQKIAVRMFGEKYLFPKTSYSKLLFSSFPLKIIFFKEFLLSKEISRKINGSFNFFIGTDATGLIIAYYVSEKNNSNLVYYNLELLLESECQSIFKLLTKSIERELNRKCAFTIIQDSTRSNHLIQDNSIGREKILLLPVSALGDQITSKSTYFHDLFGINYKKKIVLYAGNISEWSMCLELAQSVKNWPEEYVLIMHSWNKPSNNYLKQITPLVDNKKIFLSTQPVSWSDLPLLLSGADIGLAFYKNLGKNFYETGLSSNKLAQYLQVGLPVITSDYPTFHEIIYKYRCGLCTNNLDTLCNDLEQIMNNYETYRENAFLCFNEVYNFSRNFDKVLEKLKEL